MAKKKRNPRFDKKKPLVDARLIQEPAQDKHPQEWAEMCDRYRKKKNPFPPDLQKVFADAPQLPSTPKKMMKIWKAVIPPNATNVPKPEGARHFLKYLEAGSASQQDTKYFKSVEAEFLAGCRYAENETQTCMKSLWNHKKDAHIWDDVNSDWLPLLGYGKGVKKLVVYGGIQNTPLIVPTMDQFPYLFAFALVASGLGQELVALADEQALTKHNGISLLEDACCFLQQRCGIFAKFDWIKKLWQKKERNTTTNKKKKAAAAKKKEDDDDESDESDYESDGDSTTTTGTPPQAARKKNSTDSPDVVAMLEGWKQRDKANGEDGKKRFQQLAKDAEKHGDRLAAADQAAWKYAEKSRDQEYDLLKETIKLKATRIKHSSRSTSKSNDQSDDDVIEVWTAPKKKKAPKTKTKNSHRTRHRESEESDDSGDRKMPAEDKHFRRSRRRQESEDSDIENSFGSKKMSSYYKKKSSRAHHYSRRSRQQEESTDSNDDDSFSYDQDSKKASRAYHQKPSTYKKSRQARPRDSDDRKDTAKPKAERSEAGNSRAAGGVRKKGYKTAGLGKEWDRAPKGDNPRHSF